ncbi:isochorismatase domain-containing protein 2-like protein [Leptotrombidium deliense]|uniref:Isochorismatase domain-containing protein 2-like protein n=1 Tax=Leptotrombidium deliense TaxID=299467 RepID=A0A443SPD5_9ACAR|nr:isochorismatase domain-containing protein 2-like protein [Leptotrombidium deliense]
MACNKVGRLVCKESALFLCDMQEKFRNMIQYFPQIVEVSSRLLKAARILDIPVVVTEQYPKGLGATVPELGVQDYPDIKPIPKTQFSMMTDEVMKQLKTDWPSVKSIVLCGIETHVCIQGTCLSLLEQGYDVHVVVDGCSSRTMVDRMFAFDRMKSAGAYLTTSESVILSILGGSAHPKFKECQKLIMTSAPDSGLLSIYGGIK